MISRSLLTEQTVLCQELPSHAHPAYAGKNDWLVLRYADVLRLGAEALAKQAGGTAPAPAAVPRIRCRSRGVPCDAPNLLLLPPLPALQTKSMLTQSQG